MAYAYLQTGQDARRAGAAAEAPGDRGALRSERRGSAPRRDRPACSRSPRFPRAGRSSTATGRPRPRSSRSPRQFPYTDAMTYFARALGAAHTGALADGARVDRRADRSCSDRLAQANETYWAEQVGDPARRRRGVPRARREAKPTRRCTSMRTAATREDATEKNAVTPGPIAPARELLGDMLLELKQPAAGAQGVSGDDEEGAEPLPRGLRRGEGRVARRRSGHRRGRSTRNC